jgi:hypothetical protein
MGLLSLGVKPSHRLEYINALLRLGTWLRSQTTKPSFEDRKLMYRYLNREVLKNEPLTYLEFGVAAGDSLRFWALENRHPKSRLFGFDTFTGLPEDWRHFGGVTPRGTFDLRGDLPSFDDSRIVLIPGLFQCTLPSFLWDYQHHFRGGRRLVVNLDADLYSSTLYVLAKLDAHLPSGSLLIFDEFDAALDEFRAFQDYIEAFRRSYHTLARTDPPQIQLAMQLGPPAGEISEQNTRRGGATRPSSIAV